MHICAVQRTLASLGNLTYFYSPDFCHCDIRVFITFFKDFYVFIWYLADDDHPLLLRNVNWLSDGTYFV